MSGDTPVLVSGDVVTIERLFPPISMSHELSDLPAGHKCRRNHGHNYVVSVIVGATRLDEFGFVTDFGELEQFKDYLQETFDHRLLNDVVDFHPTAENLAIHLGAWFIDHVEPGIHGYLVSVRVAETGTGSATWTRGARP